MKNKTQIFLIAIAVIGFYGFAGSSVFANGGPFMLKYPNGDPAAKGVLARLDPGLKPGRETRLRVIKEDLKVTFGHEHMPKINTEGPPLTNVSAQYTIENPTNEPIEVDFGFPILRGIYVSPFAMMPTPDVKILFGQKQVKCTIISNSAIYGIIRQRAREIIKNAINEDQKLNNLIIAIQSKNPQDCETERKILYAYLTDTMKWNQQDAALLVEYAGLDFGKLRSHPPDRMGWWMGSDSRLIELMNDNLGPLAAIGEQKATQFFAQLASCFKPETTAAYDSIFTAWGGDVRERSVDLETGEIRPREITVNPEMLNKPTHLYTDTTIYARIDYLDPKANVTENEKSSCKAILKNLPVIFTFAPMNILHYQVKFPAKSTQTLTVSYSQYAYSDTRSPSSYQLAYVLHPASFWKEFGPINLEVIVPEGVTFRASDNAGIEAGLAQKKFRKSGPDIFTGKLKSKTGELYLAVDAASWKKSVKKVVLGELKTKVQTVAQQAK